MILSEFEAGSALFYEPYTVQQNALAEYCRTRFYNDNPCNFPRQLHQQVKQFMDRDYQDIFGTHRVLGGYLVPWIAKTIGINDSQVIEQAAYATFLGRAWFILWDYEMDEPEKVVNLRTVIEPLRLAALDAYLSFVPKQDRDKFKIRYDELLSKSRFANEWEMDQRGKRIDVYSRADLEKVGQKIAVVNWTTYALALAGEKPDTGEQLAKVMDNVFSAIQLNHDITDVEEDWRMENCTLPIALALKQLCPKDGGFLQEAVSDKQLILQAAFSKNILSETTGWVNYFAVEGIKASEGLLNCPFTTHLQYMITRVEALLKELDIVIDDDERQDLIVETLKRNQGHPLRHNIAL